MTARATLDAHTSERDFQRMVLDYLRLHGYLCYHPYDSRRSVPGFPDIIAIRGAHLLAIELKSQAGYVTKSQQEWLEAFAGVDRVEALMVKPEGWDQLVELLQRDGRAR